MPRHAQRRTALHLAAFLACVVAGCAPPAGEARKAPPPPTVRTIQIAQQQIQAATTQPATVRAFYRAEIRARVSGYLKELHVDIGDYVEAGVPLAVIDVPDLEARRHMLAAEVDRCDSQERRAAAGVQLAEAGVIAARAALDEAQSEVSRAEALLAAREAEFNRTRDLVQRQSLENRLLDEARKQRDAERANREAAASAIRSAEAQIAVAEARRAAAQADQDAARADTEVAGRRLAELQVMLDYATLRAPFAGVVTHRAAEIGDLVREGEESRPLFVVSQIDRVRVHVTLPELDAARVRRGDAASLSFPSFQDEPPRTGAVERVAGELDPASRTMLVEIVVPNEDRKLLPGMFGQATITLGAQLAANVLPARAVRFDEAGAAFVYVVNDDQTVAIVPVEIGWDTGETLEIRGGVEPGQRVIDAHLRRFREGQQVTLVNSPSP